jgi:hypothetical protein
VIKSFKKTRITILAVGLICALALLVNHLSSAGQPASARDTKDQLTVPVQLAEIAGYKKWTKVNAVPQLMPERVAAACYLWMAPGGVVVDGDTNPHRDTYFTVYVNDAGQKAMLKQKNPVFPKGSVIVKEKLPAKDSQSPQLLTVMIKQKKGFNPANGDWEYMVVDGTGTTLQGRGLLQNCQACHLANKKTDYIFRTYLAGEVARRLK